MSRRNPFCRPSISGVLVSQPQWKNRTLLPCFAPIVLLKTRPVANLVIFMRVVSEMTLILVQSSKHTTTVLNFT